ncbi:MAG: nitroreductase, partial [Eubacterium sp.]|nr:nitroreductase [Eubacterium sp.]
MDQIFELIKTRRSVRTFDGRILTTEDRTKLLDFIEQIENPYEIPVHFRILNASEHRLSSNVLSGAVNYIAAKVRHIPHAEEAFGYTFEMLVLYAQSLGIGTTWIGGTMDRSSFETAMQLENGEIMPCVSPLGYPAKKMSLRETLMRKGVKADSRLPFEELFFSGTFSRPMTPAEADSLFRPLEAVRLAPSAVNKQPWRVVKIENA